MYEDDDWVIGEDFLDDFIPRNEKEVGEEENPSKRQKVNSAIEENPISFSPAKNENPEPEKPESSKENTRLNKILQICNKASRISQKKQRSKSPEIHPTQNPRSLSFQESESPETNVNYFESLGNDSEDAENVEIDFENRENNPENLEDNSEKSKTTSKSPEESSQAPPHDNIRANLIKSILNRTKRTELEETKIPENSKKVLTRQNLVNSILKRGNRGNREENLSENSEIVENFQDQNLQKSPRNVSFSGDANEKEKRQKLIFSCLNKRKNDDSGSKANENSKSREDPRLKSRFDCRDESTRNESKNNSRTKNDSRSTSRTKQVITRKFPGPAGLLPDNLDFSNFPMAYLNSFEDSENERRTNDTRISNFCSQNTKNLFTSGAWQLMIDDLPVDFFQGQDLATIKRNAKKGLYKTARTEFFAAIVHHIDSNSIVNAMIVLKDSTDEVDASIHRNIFFMYPNTIEVGAVILLKDVAIISSKAYIIALIHPRDVVAIYNEKERIVTTETMERILKEQGGNSQELSENRSVENLNFRRDEGHLETGGEAPDEDKENLSKASKARKPRTKEVANPPENLSPTQVFEDEEDEFLSQLNLEEISATQGPRHIASSTLIGSQIILEKESSPVEKGCELRQETSERSSKLYNRLKQFKHREDLTQEVNIESEKEMRNESTERTSNLHNRLKQFKHTEDLTQEVSIENDEEKRKENSKTSNFDDLLDSEDETPEKNTTLGKKDKTDKNDKTDRKDKPDKKVDRQNPGPSKVQNRFNQFRHKKDLTPRKDKVQNEKKSQGKSSETANFADLLDSGDEVDEGLTENYTSPNSKESAVSEKGDQLNKSKNPEISKFSGTIDHVLEEEMSQIDFNFNLDEDSGSDNPRGDLEQDNQVKNLFNDQADEILSQMNMDDFEI